MSEALGVRFADVDLQAGTWQVAGQLADDGTVRPAKTPGSMATLPLSAAAIAVVREQRGVLLRRGFAFSPRRTRSCSSGWTGSRSDATGRSQRGSARHQAMLGEPLWLHDLRANVRLAAGGEQRGRGHGAGAAAATAKPSTTLDIYTRVLGDATAKLERMRAALDASS